MLIEFLKFITTNLPTFFSYFVPGYIFLIIYRYFAEIENTQIEHTAIKSVAISCPLSLIAQLITQKPCLPEEASPEIISISIGLAVIFVIIVLLLRKTKISRWIHIGLGGTTENQLIWNEIFLPQKSNTPSKSKPKVGKALCALMCENGIEYTVKGKIAFFCPFGESGCYVALQDYHIVRNADQVLCDENWKIGAFLLLDVSKLYCLETIPLIANIANQDAETRNDDESCEDISE